MQESTPEARPSSVTCTPVITLAGAAAGAAGAGAAGAAGAAAGAAAGPLAMAYMMIAALLAKGEARNTCRKSACNKLDP